MEILQPGAVKFPQVEEFPKLVHRSLKRTYDLFIGNYGLRPTVPPFIRDLKIRQKFVTEYEPFTKRHGKRQRTTLSSEEATDNLLMLADIRGTAASGPSSSNALMPAKSSETQAGREAGFTKKLEGKASAIVASGETRSAPTANLEITLRRPVKIPQAAKHHPWKLMRVVAGHQGWVRCLAIDPANQWFVSSGNDRLIKFWDLASGTLKLSLTGHINTVRGLAVSDRHPYLFSCGEDNAVKCWDLEYNKAIRSYHGHLSGVYSMALHPSVDVLATGGRDAVVRLWDMRTKMAVHVFSGHTGTVMSLQAQKLKPQLISGSTDKMVKTWDLVAGKCSTTLTHHKKSIRSLAVHPTEYSFCSAAADHIKVWTCPDARFDRNIEGASEILNTCAIRDEGDSSILFAGGDGGGMHFWDWSSGKKFQTTETIPQPGSLPGENGVMASLFDKSETRLLTAECDKTIKVWKEDDSLWV
eukprot:GHVO01063059.1.p1 GENE.GHVO01063059.1~~GHVO01063059.1.p1  ORF type:complete len:470 (+),score=72.13 GHVO01063059.1:2-1411(+)